MDVVPHMEESERKEAKPETKEAILTPGLNVRSVTEHVQAANSEDSNEEEIDVCSEKFNPLLALYSPNVQVPFPKAKLFNNVAEYESFLKGGRGRAKPENVEKRRQKAMKGVADPERIEKLKKLMVNNPVAQPEEGESSGTQRRKKKKPLKNVLTRMPLCAGSPLGELYRCVQERIRVKVHIRTFKGLRGVCSGFVVAFDKFWNMAMVDVDETYREPLLGQAFYHEKALTISRLFEKLKLQETSGGEEAAKMQDIQVKHSEHQAETSNSSTTDPKEISQKKVAQKYGKVHTRHINQLFIRGENVILVSPQPI